MSDTQPTQNTEKEEKLKKETPEANGATKRIGKFFIGILTEGLGSAFGVAIVAFVAYTVVGVYQIQQSSRELQNSMKEINNKIVLISDRQYELEKSFLEIKNSFDERSQKLREEIIQSNQIAMDLLLEQTGVKKSEKNSPVGSVVPSAPKGVRVAESPLLTPEEKLETDALKYRFRVEQRRIQEKW